MRFRCGILIANRNCKTKTLEERNDRNVLLGLLGNPLLQDIVDRGYLCSFSSTGLVGFSEVYRRIVTLSEAAKLAAIEGMEELDE